MRAEQAQLQGLLREKDAALDALRKEAALLKEELRRQEQQQQHLVGRLQEQERDLLARERKEKAKLQKEAELLQQRLADVELARRLDVQAAQTEFERVSRDLRVVAEEKQMLAHKLRDAQGECEGFRSDCDRRRNDQETCERELRRLQDKHREALAQLQALRTDKEHLEKSVALAEQARA